MPQANHIRADRLAYVSAALARDPGFRWAIAGLAVRYAGRFYPELGPWAGAIGPRTYKSAMAALRCIVHPRGFSDARQCARAALISVGMASGVMIGGPFDPADAAERALGFLLETHAWTIPDLGAHNIMTASEPVWRELDRLAGGA